MAERTHTRASENTTLTLSCPKEMKARLRLIAGRKGSGSLSAELVAILEPQLPAICRSLGITQEEVDSLASRL
ncbi:MAG: hypothetical protein ABII82_18065 [Verrucomicrobiota bacterium]